MIRLSLVAVTCGVLVLETSVSPAAITVDEALSLSKQTGRPIFAVAGSET